jgi:hypothetical protein
VLILASLILITNVYEPLVPRMPVTEPISIRNQIIRSAFAARVRGIRLKRTLQQLGQTSIGALDHVTIPVRDLALARRFGSVSSRARWQEGPLCRTLCVLPDVGCELSFFGEAKATEGGEDSLVVAAAQTKKVTEFTVLSAEALGCLAALEAAHTSDLALDTAVVLLVRIPMDSGRGSRCAPATLG